jgi:hypothetical protein
MKITLKTRNLLCLLLTGAAWGAGCASRTAVSSAEPNAPAAPAQTFYEGGISTAEVVDAAGDVLTRMHFVIEKLDAEQGLVRTRPLRGAQFFEVWRSDNASTFAWEEANVQSIRRAVELRVRPEDRGQRTEDRRQKTEDGGQTTPPSSVLPGSSRLCVACTVSVQRLSRQDEAAGSSGAYRIYSNSAANLQWLEAGPQQRRAMAWIDIGQDRDLAARILARVEQRLQRVN